MGELKRREKLKKFVFVLSLAIIFGFSLLAEATLYDRGEHFVYDSDQDITWLRDAGKGGLQTWDDAVAWAAGLDIGGFSDWRMPTIKELYSLITFDGTDPSGLDDTADTLTPFIDTDFFDFEYGDTSAGERIIDAQYWSCTQYISTTMGGAATAFICRASRSPP